MKPYLSLSLALSSGIALTGHLAVAHAQAPIDIERKAADGEYMAALALYDRMPKRIATPLSIIAAAKSAWALGLSERALSEYDSALRSGTLSPVDTARIMFAKAAIYLQSQRFQLAVLAIDDGIAKLSGPSPLRGAMFVLKAQAMASQKLYPATVEILTKARDEIGEESATELNYLLGASLGQVGRYAEAKESLRKIPSTHERAADGIKELIRIADAEHDTEKAALWVSKGREAFPDAFLDGWYDYLLVTGAIARDQRAGDYYTEIFELREAAEKRLAPSDSWLALIVAASEEHAWTRTQGRRQSALIRGATGGSHE